MAEPRPGTTIGRIAALEQAVAHLIGDLGELRERERLLSPSPGAGSCCDLHGRNCEPPGDLCCENCTEADHPAHTRLGPCSVPVLSPNSPEEARRIAMAVAAERERIYAELGNDHYVIFTEDRWTIEHSVECRLSGHMPECTYHEAIARIAAEYDPGMAGRWRIDGIDSEGLPNLLRQGGEGGKS